MRTSYEERGTPQSLLTPPLLQAGRPGWKKKKKKKKKRGRKEQAGQEGTDGSPNLTEGRKEGMTNIYSMEGVLSAALLFVCACSYLRRVPVLRRSLMRPREGPLGVLYKAALVGRRLHAAVSLACTGMAVYLLFIS